MLNPSYRRFVYYRPTKINKYINVNKKIQALCKTYGLWHSDSRRDFADWYIFIIRFLLIFSYFLLSPSTHLSLFLLRENIRLQFKNKTRNHRNSQFKSISYFLQNKDQETTFPAKHPLGRKRLNVLKKNQ